VTNTEQGEPIMNSKKETLEKKLDSDQKRDTFGTYDEPISSEENLDTEEAGRRFALYHKQTETHLKQEKQKYKSILEDNDGLNKLVERLTAERSASEATTRKIEARLR
jgi:hypothetical protein